MSYLANMQSHRYNRYIKIMAKKITLQLPFYFEATRKRDNDGFPQTFPFHLTYDQKLGIYHQKNSRALKKILDEAYLKGSMLSGGMNDLVVGGARVDEAFEFIKKNYPLKKSTTVLEIGCGEGQVLKKLAQMDLSCVGLEPGPQVLQITENNITIIKDFFPSKQVKGTFDLMLHFGVLEHIADPLKFLKEQTKFLNPGGAIFLAVPNCENDLKAGDISVFLHEHYNYFTKYGLQKLARAAGLIVEKMIVGNDNAFLYVKLSKKHKKIITKKESKPFSEHAFEKEMKKFSEKVKKYFKDKKQSDTAIYCPLRGMNLLSSLNINNCRLIDDNKNLYQKYLPTFNKKIENFDSIKQNPPKRILVYSRTFAAVIKKKCTQTKELKDTLVQTVDELT